MNLFKFKFLEFLDTLVINIETILRSLHCKLFKAATMIILKQIILLIKDH